MIRWIGHATIRINADHRLIFFDPYQLKERARADLILVSHEHFDHCSLDDLRRISVKKTHIVGPPSIKGAVQRVTHHYHMIEAGGEIEVRNIKIKAVPAYNIDKPFHPKHAGGLGYVIEVDNKKIYFAGDTDLIPEMEELVDIDTAILPVGGTYTMDAEEAAKAFKLIGAKEGIPMHYGSVIGTCADGDRFKRLIAQID